MGQVLKKATGSNYDVQWDDEEAPPSSNVLQFLFQDLEASLTIVSGVQARTNPRQALSPAVDLDDYEGGVVFVEAAWSLSNGAGALATGKVDGRTLLAVSIADLKASNVYNAASGDYGVALGTTVIYDSSECKEG